MAFIPLNIQTKFFLIYRDSLDNRIFKICSLLEKYLTGQEEHGLPTSLKTNLMFGTAYQRSIYQGD